MNYFLRIIIVRFVEIEGKADKWNGQVSVREPRGLDKDRFVYSIVSHHQWGALRSKLTLDCVCHLQPCVMPFPFSFFFFFSLFFFFFFFTFFFFFWPKNLVSVQTEECVARHDNCQIVEK